MARGTFNLERASVRGAVPRRRILGARRPRGADPAWDFQSVIRDRDVSATAIVATGPFEMIGFVEDPAVRTHHRSAAGRMLASLCRPPYLVGGDTNCLLDHSVQYLPINGNVDVPAIFADYDYLEAIVRCRALRASGR